MVLRWGGFWYFCFLLMVGMLELQAEIPKFVKSLSFFEENRELKQMYDLVYDFEVMVNERFTQVESFKSMQLYSKMEGFQNDITEALGTKKNFDASKRNLNQAMRNQLAVKKAKKSNSEKKKAVCLCWCFNCRLRKRLKLLIMSIRKLVMKPIMQ